MPLYKVPEQMPCVSLLLSVVFQTLHALSSESGEFSSPAAWCQALRSPPPRVRSCLLQTDRAFPLVTAGGDLRDALSHDTANELGWYK